jgi:Domain of unknown function (DUF4136)
MIAAPGPDLGGRAAHRRAGVGLCAAILAAAALAACDSMRVASDYDHGASFSGYHSFAWLPRTQPTTSPANPLVRQRAHDATQAELIRKGYVYTDDAASADFVVDITMGSRERVDVQSYPATYMGPGWGYNASWGYPYWGSSVDVHQYREGTLSIDIFDGRSHRPVWHGWASKELTQSDIENSAAPIQAAVASVLAKFPPS